MNTTGWTVKGQTITARWLTGYQWARYDASGVRIETPDGSFGRSRDVPTAEMLAAWDAEAPAKAAELLAEAAAERARSGRLARIGAIAAKYDGVCAVSGRRYRRGAMIARAERGWALAEFAGINDQIAAMRGADVARLMDHADSTL